ncbi:MAG: T9SS type A sorting domain-containing protein [Chitinophagales bacterium]
MNLLKMQINPALFLFCIITIAVQLSAQERIYDLDYNPQLYHSNYNPDAANQLGLVKNDYLIVPDTINIPFLEDFARDRLFQRKPWNNLVFDTILRSVQLGSITDSLEFMFNTSWDYTVNGGVLDSTPKKQDTLILNDDPFDPQRKTDTLIVWPAFYRYTLNGGTLDSVKVEPDSTIVYSEFKLIRDPNARWLENQVFINSTNVLEKLSNNVATFDGLNENGLPYDPDQTNSGPADTLTSQAMDLSSFSFNDSLYLSFFYVSTGLGNKPEPEDSLILEFNKNGVWDIVWSSPGFASVNDVIEDWKAVIIPIDDNFYFTKTFQFRFRNKATLTGNNDHWHIDYIYLAANRSDIDTVMRDVSVLNPPTNFLDRYTSMPWNQYEGFEAQETAEELFLSFKNNFSVAQTISFSYQVNEIDGNNIYNIFDFPTQGTSLPPFSPFSIGFPTSNFVPFNINTQSDSVLIELTSYIDEIPSALSTNTDTARMLVPFYNYLAYDDGSAEKAYGLEGPGLKNFAYEFNLNVPDTLRAIQFHFTQINFDASDLLFTLKVWSEINLSGNGNDVLIYEKEFQKPRYVARKNGFVTYRLDTPLLVSGSFYVGWDQTDEENIQVGLDLNNSAQSYMYYKIGNNWNNSLVEAAPMIRPILGKELPVAVPEIEAKAAPEFTIYPNPSNAVYNIKVSEAGKYTYNIFDLQGKRVQNGSFFGDREQFSLQREVAGFYLLQIADLDEQKSYAFRLIKL